MTTLTLDALTASAESVAGRIADQLAMPIRVDFGGDYGPASPRWRDQSLAKGAAGVAVLHGVRRHTRRGAQTRVRAWLAVAARDDLSAASGAGLWFGAPALAFALHTAAPGEYRQAAGRLDAAVVALVRRRLDAAHARIDARQRPALSEFDLVRGLTGLGAYLLRRDPHGGLFHRVLDYLVRLTEPVPARDAAARDAPGWWTSDPPAGADRVGAGGHTDLGAAHGISGPLALLALAARVGATVDGHLAAIARICGWLDTWRQHGAAGAWWPERIDLDELRTSRPRQTEPARPSWCYGTPGIARAQQLAALATRNPARQAMAETALADCLADPSQVARIIDPALCHGWAGLTATAWAAAADSDNPALHEHLPAVLRGLIAHADDPIRDDLPGLIDGRAGIALTLHTIATAAPTGWQTCLLIN